MLSKQYFVVRPTAEGQRRFQELGIENEEDVVNPRIWLQDFDLRVTVNQDPRQWCVDVVMLQYIAQVLTELEEIGVTALSHVSLDELTRMWSVEWIDGGLLDCDEVEFTPYVVQRLVAESKDKGSSVSSELEKVAMRSKWCCPKRG